MQADPASAPAVYSEQSYPAYGAPVMSSAGYPDVWNSPPASMPKQSSLFKTQLCRHFDLKGFCNLGESCSFAHGKEELKEAPPRSSLPPTSNPEGELMQSYKAPTQGAVDYSQYYKTVLCKHFDQSGQ